MNNDPKGLPANSQKYGEILKGEDVPNPAQEIRQFHPTDIILRKNGFTLVERRKGKEAVWARNGVRFREEEALLRIQGAITNDGADSTQHTRSNY